MKGEVSRKRIAVIGDEETVAAFRLGGIGRFYSEEESDLDLKAVLADKSLGVLIVTEKFAEENRKAIERHRLSDARTPVVVEVPGISGQDSGRENPIDRLIKRAIGTDRL